MIKNLILVLFLIVASAQAQISVDRMIVEMPASAPPVYNVQVFNTDETRTIRVETLVKHMIKPWDDTDTGTEGGPLLVSPRTFTIPPNSQRTLRLVLKERPTDLENVFRVQIIPKESDAPVKGAEPKKDKFGIQLKVLYGVGMLVYASAADAKPKFQWSYTEKNKMRIKNVGNVNVLLNTIVSCNEAWLECSELDVGNRMYATEEREFEIKKGERYRIRVEHNNGTIDVLEFSGEAGEVSVP